MKIKLQENEVSIVKLGDSKENNGVYTRTVTFEMNGRQFDREILLTPNGTGADYEDFNNFYAMNKETVDASLTEYFSENHTYLNQPNP